MIFFLMPYGIMVGPFVITWFISSWFQFDKEKFFSGAKNPWFLTMIFFLILHVVSGLLSDNKQEGLTGIETKLSFLAFPYFFFLFNISDGTVKRSVIAFVTGCFFALMICIFRATYIYLTNGENEFFYNLFSVLIHAGYFSMYMLFCILIVAFVYPKWFGKDKWVGIISYFLILAFLTGIFLCASKIGYIAAVIILIIAPVIRFRHRLNLKIFGISLVVLLTTFFVLLKTFPKPFERLNNVFTTLSAENIDKTSGESTAVRLLIWHESMEIVKENFLLGVGTGDANDVLQNRYKENGLTGALEHNLNTHNQFFQTAIALGVVGLLVLFILTIGVLIYALIKKQTLLILFSIIIILNFLVESMLQTQSGNLFFVGFLCILLVKGEVLRKQIHT
jgi:O-antigen ligase